MIQYSGTFRFNLKGRGVLDTPPAWGMTAFRRITWDATALGEPRAWLQRRAAQKFLRLHRRLAGALQFENSDRAFAAGNPELIVEDLTSRAKAMASD